MNRERKNTAQQIKANKSKCLIFSSLTQALLTNDFYLTRDSVKFVDQRAPFCDMLSTELTGTEKLLNPNLFVETGMSIQLV